MRMIAAMLAAAVFFLGALALWFYSINAGQNIMFESGITTQSFADKVRLIGLLSWSIMMFVISALMALVGFKIGDWIAERGEHSKFHK